MVTMTPISFGLFLRCTLRPTSGLLRVQPVLIPLCDLCGFAAVLGS